MCVLRLKEIPLPPASGMVIRERGGFWSQDDADQAAAAFVDDSFDGLLQFHPGVGGHPVEFVAESFVDQLVEGFPEDVGFPDLLRVFLEFFQKL